MKIPFVFDHVKYKRDFLYHGPVNEQWPMLLYFAFTFTDTLLFIARPSGVLLSPTGY